MINLEVEESGRPILFSNEVELSIYLNVDLPAAKLYQLTFRITTNRIIIQKMPKFNKMIKLEDILSCESVANGWFTTSTTFKITTINSTLLEFSSAEKENIVTQLKTLLEEKSRKQLCINNQPIQTEKKFASQNAGVSGIIKKKEERHLKNTQTMDESFSDLKILMGKAHDMVVLAEYLRNNHTKNQNNEVNMIISEMGIVSPVTKETAGSLFHQELAKQLFDFLKLPLQKDGIMSLTDVYCIYNRARGTGLISPEDLFNACVLFDSLDLPLQMKSHSSGLITIQLKSFEDSVMISKIKILVKENAFPLSIVQFSSIQQISIVLAKYYLLKAEEELILCRDESVEGLIFYPNIFL